MSVRLESLIAVADEQMRELHVPGVAIGIVDGQHEEVAGLGVTDVERPYPVDADTVFNIASITKTFTATTLVVLAAETDLDLDRPVRERVTGFTLADTSAAARVSARHLLTHTGGWIGENLPHAFDGADALQRAAESCGSLPQVTGPGELFSYNNAGYSVAGAVVEAAADKPYEDVVRERVIERAGLTRTTFVPPNDTNVAAEHTIRDGRPVVIAPWRSDRSSAPVGGLRSTVRDLMRYARAHLVDSLVRADLASAMRTQIVSDGSPDGGMGLGWAMSNMSGVTVISHGGATVSHMSSLMIVPERSFALVVLTNGALGGQVTRALSRRALLELGIERLAMPPTRRMAEGLLQRYAGQYAWPTSAIQLEPVDGCLELRLTWRGSVAERPPIPPMRLEFWDDDRVVCVEGQATGAYGDFPRPDLFRWSSRARPRRESTAA